MTYRIGKEILKEAQAKNRTLNPACLHWLDWQNDFKTFDWINAVGDLEATNKEISHLLSLT
jgi:hypothetical protein